MRLFGGRTSANRSCKSIAALHSHFDASWVQIGSHAVSYGYVSVR
jgi:hypothetical protein